MDTSTNDVADILFHAAMALGSGRKSGVRSAITDALKYLHWTDDVKIWRPYHDAYRVYAMVNGHNGEAWQLRGGFHHAGRWLSPEDKQEQLLSMLFAYEYVVQEMGAVRSLAEVNHDNS